MKKAGSIVLLELCIAALILMLACASSVKMFVRARQMQEDTAARTQAMLLAQSCAEMIAASDAAADALAAAGFEMAQDGAYERVENDNMTVRVSWTYAEKEAGTLMQAQVCVEQDGTVLAQLPAACYYNKEVIHP